MMRADEDRTFLLRQRIMLALETKSDSLTPRVLIYFHHCLFFILIQQVRKKILWRLSYDSKSVYEIIMSLWIDKKKLVHKELCIVVLLKLKCLLKQFNSRRPEIISNHCDKSIYVCWKCEYSFRIIFELQGACSEKSQAGNQKSEVQQESMNVRTGGKIWTIERWKHQWHWK